MTALLSTPAVADHASELYDKALAAVKDGNFQKGAHWFKKAAHQGLTIAQYKLGVMYLNGEGVIKSNRDAFIWFNIAAVKGNKDSIAARDHVATTFSSIELERVRRQAQIIYDRINH